MKKHNISTLFKNKGFYVLLFVGLIAIAAVTTVGVRVSRNNKKDLVDLNTPSEIKIEVAENTDIEDQTNDATNTTEVAEGIKEHDTTDYTNEELLEYDAYNNTNEEEIEVANNDHMNETVLGDQTQDMEESVSVMQPSVSSNSVNFTKDSVMSWPVDGNVIMNYKTDGVIYYATLGEWKYNPAIMISSKVDTEVKAAAKGIVTSIAKHDELGTTVTMDLGNGYQVVYGQLKDVTCNVGDLVEKDSIFAKMSDPTRYYSVEGCNLYLQLLQDEKPVNPMLYLSDEE